MTDHAKYSPSNHRWPHCPASVREEASYPDVAGEAAVDGTGSHLLLELCMKLGLPASAFAGQTIGHGDPEKPLGWFVDEARQERVQMALDYLRRREQELKDQFPECRVVIESETKAYPCKEKEWWGTCDITITVLDARDMAVYLEIADYKDGRGWVDVNDNSQLQSYAIGKMYIPRWSSLAVRMTVIQPRTNPPIRYTADVPNWELSKVEDKLLAAIDAAEKPDAPCIPGDWCRWCKASYKNGGHCTEPLKLQRGNTDMSIEVMATDAPATDVVQAVIQGVKTLDLGKLGDLLALEKSYTDAFKAIREEVEFRIQQGHTVPGWEMGHGRGSRVWTSEEDAIKALKSAKLKQDEYSPRVLLTVAQAEKLLGSAVFADKVEKAVCFKDGKPTLKPAAKVRVEKEVPASLFADVPTETPSFI